MESESFLRGAVDAAIAEHTAWWVNCGMYMRGVAPCAGVQLGGVPLTKVENQHHDPPHQEKLIKRKLLLSFPPVDMVRNGSCRQALL